MISWLPAFHRLLLTTKPGRIIKSHCAQYTADYRFETLLRRENLITGTYTLKEPKSKGRQGYSRTIIAKVHHESPNFNAEPRSVETRIVTPQGSRIREYQFRGLRTGSPRQRHQARLAFVKALEHGRRT